MISVFESLLSVMFIRLPVQDLDNVHDRMKERKIGTILSTPKKVSLIYWFFSLGLFSAKIQFSLQLRYSLSFLNCLEAFKLRFVYQTYVVGPNQLIECSSVLEAVDRAFKLMFLLQLNYPEECKHLWDLIQFKFFHIKLHMVTPVVDEFLRQLKEADDNISEMAWWVYTCIWWLEMWYLLKANVGWIKNFHRWKY